LKKIITATNTLAVPVLVYSFRIVIWLRKEIEKIDWKMTKLLVDRLSLKRQNSGCRLVELESTCNVAIVGFCKCIK
jgi:hypothetical protein